MALYPKAVQKPLNKRTTPMAAYNFLCLHTMVGYLYSTDSYFRTATVDSHFGIGGAWGSDVTNNLDGVVYQWGDTRYRSAANLNGNADVISVETGDNAPALPGDIAAWTQSQCDAIVDLMVWANQTHGIPLALVPDTTPGRRGIAYHRQGVDPWRVANGTLWSNSTGKVCPGDRRIAQIPGLIERAKAKVAGIATEEVEIIMAYYASKAEFEAAVKRLSSDAVIAALKAGGVVADIGTVRDRVIIPEYNATTATLTDLKAQLVSLVASNAALVALVQALSEAPASGTSVSAEQFQDMMDKAAAKAVDSINLDVVRVETNG